MALPLSIGIAVASGAPVVAGLIAAIVGGIVCAAVGGSPLQVSGPAAGLTVVVAELVAQFGWKATCAITAAAGVLQILLGLSRIARAALAIAPIVVHAMLAGIGITIALQQVHVLLGGGPRSNAWANLVALPGQLAAPQWSEVLVGSLVIAIMLTAGASSPAQCASSRARWSPWWSRRRSATSPACAPTASSSTSPWSTRSACPRCRRALVGDRDRRAHRRPDRQRREPAVGQRGRQDARRPAHRLQPRAAGTGHRQRSSGLLGGLPITGVIVRSSTNVGRGARTRASAALHGVWLLLFSVSWSASWR